jgi:septal ring factor EnvC (AmiA/AmiB activator)
MDDDYVQNLSNELQHTKQLLKQYQLRTEQLMELVKKQTNKIADLREQLKIAQNNTNHAPE